MGLIVYFSSASGNTRRFVDKLGATAVRIPLRPSDPAPHVTRPYVLITPTYGGGATRHAVPKQVIRFLNDPGNRALIRGVITSGNANFGEAYCCAGPIIARKCGVPELFRFELLGTEHDVRVVREGLADFWAAQETRGPSGRRVARVARGGGTEAHGAESHDHPGDALPGGAHDINHIRNEDHARA